MCYFYYTAFAVNGKVGIPLTGLSIPIEWMLSVAILIDRPKLVPQLLCNRTLQCSKISKLNNNKIGFSSFLETPLFCLNIFSIFFSDYAYSNFI